MADLHLRFDHPADGGQPLHLRFGDDGGSAPPTVGAELHGRITRGLQGHAGAATLVRAGAHGRVTGLRGQMGAAWVSNVDRPERVASASRYQAAGAASAECAQHWQRAAASLAGHAAHWQHAQAGASGSIGAWRQSAARTAASDQHWQRALAQALLGTSRYQQALAHAAQDATRWQRAIAHGLPGVARYQQTYSRAAAVQGRYQRARASAAPLRSRFAQRAALRALAGIGHYQDARRPGWDGRTGVIVVPPEPPCYDPAQPLHLRFIDLAGAGLPLHLRFVCECDGSEPQPGATVVVARRRSYIVINSIEVRRVDSGQLLPALDSGFTMELERGSWTWSFGIDFHGAALPLLRPGVDGLPVELSVTVNGQPFRMLVESIERSVLFPRSVIKVHGGGRSVLLDAPYAAQQTFAQPSARTAQQLTEDVLTVGGVSMGWSLDWQITDWYIPAGTWAHQGTWISAVNDIASSVGAYVQPHDTAQVLRVLPGWPVRAWELAGATPDIELPPGIAVVEKVEWVVKPDYDALYMQGEPGTSQFFRKRAGTPGTTLAPMAVHPLLVHAAAAAQRAICELSDTGRQVEQTLRMMVLPETGIIKPGLLLRYTDDADVVRTGVTRAVSLAMDRSRLEQTIKVQARE